jgi:Cu-Zn family superoxide dismutase
MCRFKCNLHRYSEGCLLWRHIGDLGNVTADEAGAVSSTFKDQYISLKQGKEVGFRV